MTNIITTHSHSTTSQPNSPVLRSTASTATLGTEHCVRAALVGLVHNDHCIRNQGGHTGDVPVGMGGVEEAMAALGVPGTSLYRSSSRAKVRWWKSCCRRSWA